MESKGTNNNNESSTQTSKPGRRFKLSKNEELGAASAVSIKDTPDSVKLSQAILPQTSISSDSNNLSLVPFEDFKKEQENLIKTTEQSLVVATTSDNLVFNPTYDALYAQPMEGPAGIRDKYNSKAGAVGKTFSGDQPQGYLDPIFLQNESVFDHSFEMQETKNQIIGKSQNNPVRIKEHKLNKRQRSESSDSGARGYVELEFESEDKLPENVKAFSEEFFINEEDEQNQEQKEKEKGKEKGEDEKGEDEKGEKGEKEEEEKEDKEEENDKKTEKFIPQITSVFHLPSRLDYQGRNFLFPPPICTSIRQKRQSQSCKLAEGLLHTYEPSSSAVSLVTPTSNKKRKKGGLGHTKELVDIQFFPKSGHLLLSGSLDGTAKIWDVLTHQECIQTYTAHTKAVRSTKFSDDGAKFASVSYDKTVKLWDTESGKVLFSTTFASAKSKSASASSSSSGSGSATDINNVTPCCVAIYPKDPFSLLVGYTNNVVLQMDTRQKKGYVQEYDRHLGPINTITFVENGHKFVTSSDDKTLRVWEYGTPVDVKYIADPLMHSMPATCVSPNGKWFLVQSLDNQILVYDIERNFTQNVKKCFKGHKVASYACQIDMSNDGEYVISGDWQGCLFQWSWRTQKLEKVTRCHDKVLIACRWHPVHPSLVATASWDKTVKLWGSK